ncbi:MAG: DUF2254 domain-containing protein [Pararhodobacter sp.]|nr:DUF2254 domain-containing protein [Pararhodobacter sp.]
MFRRFVALRRLARELWVRVALFAVLAVLSVILAHAAAPLVPPGLAARIGPGAVTPILTILASSMLAVSTFSLATMVSAYRAAAGEATPRVMRLLNADPTVHTVLAIFIGAFVYALTALILFQAGFDGGAVLVLGVTILVTGAVVVALVRWIANLTELGTLDDALARCENAARTALASTRKEPALGAQALSDAVTLPHDARTFDAPRSGILQMIDVAGLSACANGAVWVLRRPGQAVLQGVPLARYAGTADRDALAACFVIGDSRTFEQDPGFALTVLAEIGTRALSPGINDSGTAIEVVSRLERLLWDWGRRDGPDPVRHGQVFVPVLHADDLIDAAFDAIARDGAGQIEVCGHVLDALAALARSPDDALAAAARTLAERARAHAEAGLALAADRLRLPPAAGQ